MSGVEAKVLPGEIVLDPFAHAPSLTSKVAGLGTARGESDTNYAFHTNYVEAAEGIAHFFIEFQGLSATRGTLNLRVHMLSLDSPHARLATAERIAMNRLVSCGGVQAIRFEAYHGVTYALYGEVIGDTDASATALKVTLDRPANPEKHRSDVAEARDTVFLADTTQTSFLTSLAVPKLAAPVTQAATRGQLNEPVARDLVQRLGLGKAPPLAQWRSACAIQVLATYGMLKPGARGVGLGVSLGPVSDRLASEHIDVDLISPGNDEEPPGGTASRIVQRDLTLDPLDPTIVNYDFLWTEGAVDAFGLPARGARFIETSLAVLRPGGLAVHLIDYDAMGSFNGAMFTRSDVERIALVLISRGHDVAEFRIDTTGLIVGETGRSAVCLICRRASLSH